MEHFDLLFTRVNDIGEVQQQMKTQMDIRGQAMDNYTAEQHLIAQQVKANGAAVAQLTLRHFEHEGPFEDDSLVSIIFDEEQQFENVFVKDKGPHKPETSKTKKPPPSTTRRQPCRHKRCQKCSSQSSMVTILKSGKTTARAILSYTSCPKACGSQRHTSTLKVMLPNGIKLISKITPSGIGIISAR